ncbi:MAG: hypothetical protein WEF86_02500, partial [Gemmatimonadota bacterium]
SQSESSVNPVSTIPGEVQSEVITPRGMILTPPQSPQLPYRLFEEEVPREGAIVTRAFQRARWMDGSTHVWMGRAKRIGLGESSSGLRFDVIER